MVRVDGYTGRYICHSAKHHLPSDGGRPDECNCGD